MKLTIKKIFLFGAACLASLSLTSCFDDEESTADKYKEWRERNETYIDEALQKRDENGAAYYEKIEPTWAPGGYVLIHWHNDRKLTEKNLSPMDNSTVDITYQLLDIDDKVLSDSFSRLDSVYTSTPSQNIIGVWYAMTQMHVGDSVTLVIPSQAGYGERNYSNIPPYSTLIYNIKMKAITAYEVP